MAVTRSLCVPGSRAAVERPGVGARTAAPALILAVCLAACLAVGCAAAERAPVTPPPAAGFASLTPAEAAFLDSLARRTFDFFWERSDPRTGLTPDRWPTESFSSVAAIGFALTAYPIGAERGWITLEQARERVMNTMRFLWRAPQGDASSGTTGHRGFFYHFLDPNSGARFENVELSTIDTALLMAGVLFCQSYFDGADEAEVRALAESLYTRVEWDWAQSRPPLISLGWKPGEGFLPYDWRGYNEAMLLMILALGSPTHPAGGAVWDEWARPYGWADFQGYEHVPFAPLFGHQYSHVWIDFRGIQDEYCRGKGIDYFENSRRATLAQRAYAIANPGGWRGYGERLWGLTACDGPVSRKVTIDGVEREFQTYWARGAAAGDIRDDGTIAPTAAAGSIVFAPEVVVPVLMAMRADWGEPLYGRYGFLDALNPTLREPIDVQHGKVIPGVGWFDTDYLGIDQGPILCMIENQRDGIVWNTMKRNPHLRRGLEAAGFTGGWLDAASE